MEPKNQHVPDGWGDGSAPLPAQEEVPSSDAQSSHEFAHPNHLTEEQQRDIQENKDMAALSYVWILSVVVLYARRDSPFIQYHARQGVWLFCVSIPIWLIPFVGHYITFLVVAGMIIGFLNAAQGRYHDVPLIGQLAKGTLTLRDLWKRIITEVLHWFGVVGGIWNGKKKDQTPPSSVEDNGQQPLDGI